MKRFRSLLTNLSMMSSHDDEGPTKITLIDFTHQLTNSDNHIYLISMLMKKINTPLAVPFSLNFQNEILPNLPSNYSSYDVKILYKYQAILLGGNQEPPNLWVLDIDTREVRMTITLEQSKKLTCFHVEEDATEDGNGQDYLYITDNELCKYNFTKLMEGKSSSECLVWKSDIQFSNRSTWGLFAFKADVFVCDFRKGLLKFDKMNGKFIGVIVTGCNMCNVVFTPEKEMLLTYGRLEIREMDKRGVWKSIKCLKNQGNNIIFQNPHAIFYESITRYIYISDWGRRRIVVVNKDTMEVVKVSENLGVCFGIAIDKRNGTMYVCSENGQNLLCLK